MRERGIRRAGRQVITIALVVLGTMAMAQEREPLRSLTVRLGDGPAVAVGDEVLLHESTSLMDGTLIFSTWDSGQPIKFCFGGGQVIEGLEQAVLGMRVGEVRYAVIPPHLSKRTRYPDSFGPDDTLSFKFEVVDIVGKDCVARREAERREAEGGEP